MVVKAFINKFLFISMFKIRFLQLSVLLISMQVFVIAVQAEQEGRNGRIHISQLAADPVYAALAMENHLSFGQAERGEKDNDAPPVHVDEDTSAIGILHPFLQVEGKYVDNLYRLNDDSTDDFIMTLSPGLWLAAPRSRKRILDIKIRNARPGGLMTDLETGRSFQRLQTYLLATTDVVSYARKSQNNFAGYTAEGFFQYNLPVGLRIEAADQFHRSFEPFGVDGSGPGHLYKYNANIFLLSFKYNPGGQFRLQGDYSNFFLDYDDEIKNFNNRVDNGVNFYIWHDYSPKTSFFFNEKYVHLDFDTDRSKNSDQYDTSIGFRWLPSDKTRFRVKMGYVNRIYDDDTVPSANGALVEMNAFYRFTIKTSLQLSAASLLNIPNESVYNYRRDNLLRLMYLQEITEKFIFGFSGKMGQLTYKGNRIAEREDNIYTIGPYIQYKMRDWLGARMGYTYEKRSSDLERYDFTNNMVSLRIQASF
ncbi:outer membrane beta-barrel protein [Thermodesulfobacteriota bacterium B35]